MKKLVITFSLVIMLIIQALATGNSTSKSEEGIFSYEASAGFYNKYLWRGICYNNGLVFQPEAVVYASDFYFSVWSNVTLWDVDDIKSNEVDFTLGYNRQFLNLDVDASFSYFNYIQQEDAPNTGELTIGLAYPLGGFSVFAGGSVDLIAYKGGFWCEAGVEYERELSETFSIYGSVGAGLGSSIYNENYLGINKSAFNIVSTNLVGTYAPTENFSIDASLQYNITVDQELIDAIDKNSYLLGLTLRWEF